MTAPSSSRTLVPALLLASLVLFGVAGRAADKESATETKPLRALMITGGCSTD